jgi:hypothetical protein
MAPFGDKMGKSISWAERRNGPQDNG